MEVHRPGSRLRRLDPRLAESPAFRAACWKSWKVVSPREVLWHEMCSEFDARRLSQHVHSLGVMLSEDFLRFEARWLQDEHSHYLGFRQILARLYRLSPAALDRAVRARVSAMGSLATFLGNEFHLCALLAYDEFVTAQAYAVDFPVYDSLGDQALSRWIRDVCRAEVRHFRTLAQLLRIRYAGRERELRALLEALVDHDLRLRSYKGTFVLDHPDCPPGLLFRARSALLASYVGR